MLPLNSPSRWTLAGNLTAPISCIARQPWLNASGEAERYVYNAGLAFHGDRKPTPFENLQHRRVLRQDLCGKLFEAGLARDGNQMLQQLGADTLPLVFVDHREGHLC